MRGAVKIMKEQSYTRTRAQELRKNATKQENLLWYRFLRTYPVQFRRQKVIGPYIADFFCSKAKLIIEVDGGQHYETPGLMRDQQRSFYLETLRGFRVLRFTNLEIEQQFEEVCTVIDRTVREAAPSSVSLLSTASPQGEAMMGSPPQGPFRPSARTVAPPPQGGGAPTCPRVENRV